MESGGSEQVWSDEQLTVRSGLVGSDVCVCA